MQSEHMFFIWILPHTSLPVDTISLCPLSQCAVSSHEAIRQQSVSFRNKDHIHYIPRRANEKDCNTELPEDASHPNMTAFFSH